MNIILTGTSQIDRFHAYVTIGQNCWGIGDTAKESLKNCKANAPRGTRLFITRVAPKDGLRIDPVDGSIWFNETHDARNCPVCTVGKGIRINTDNNRAG